MPQTYDIPVLRKYTELNYNFPTKSAQNAQLRRRRRPLLTVFINMVGQLTVALARELTFTITNRWHEPKQLTFSVFSGTTVLHDKSVLHPAQSSQTSNSGLHQLLHKIVTFKEPRDEAINVQFSLRHLHTDTVAGSPVSAVNERQVTLF